MTSSVNCWDVFYLFCKHTKPNPKNKFIIVMCFETTPMGLLINSHVNAFVKNRPPLMQCEVQILEKDHSFLSYDSFVDCREIFDFHLNELTDRRGEIAVSARPQILTAVANCPVLPRKYKEMIAMVNASNDEKSEDDAKD